MSINLSSFPPLKVNLILQRLSGPTRVYPLYDFCCSHQVVFFLFFKLFCFLVLQLFASCLLHDKNAQVLLSVLQAVKEIMAFLFQTFIYE